MVLCMMVYKLIVVQKTRMLLSATIHDSFQTVTAPSWNQLKFCDGSGSKLSSRFFSTYLPAGLYSYVPRMIMIQLNLSIYCTTNILSTDLPIFHYYVNLLFHFDSLSMHQHGHKICHNSSLSGNASSSIRVFFCQSVQLTNSAKPYHVSNRQ